MNFSEHVWNMSLAIEVAEDAYREDEVPIGAVIVSPDGKPVSRAHNLKEKTFDPCGHAEILAIKEACDIIQNWRLEDHWIYTTLEPCPMCLSAMIHARVKGLIFGAYDSKGGAITLGYSMHKDSRLNHNISVIGGVQHYRCSKLISNFFKEKRKSYKSANKF